MREPAIERVADPRPNSRLLPNEDRAQTHGATENPFPERVGRSRNVVVLDDGDTDVTEAGVLEERRELGVVGEAEKRRAFRRIGGKFRPNLRNRLERMDPDADIDAELKPDPQV